MLYRSEFLLYDLMYLRWSQNKPSQIYFENRWGRTIGFLNFISKRLRRGSQNDKKGILGEFLSYIHRVSEFYLLRLLFFSFMWLWIREIAPPLNPLTGAVTVCKSTFSFIHSFIYSINIYIEWLLNTVLDAGDIAVFYSSF